MLIPKLIDDTVFNHVNSYTISQFHTQEWNTVAARIGDKYQIRLTRSI